MAPKTIAPKSTVPEVTLGKKITPPPALPTIEGTGGVVVRRPPNDLDGGSGGGTNGTATNGAASSKAPIASHVKSAPDIVREEAGLNGDLNRPAQHSWSLFLNSFDDV